nr:reverse transcriptase domain-containing protein [Tanacetum cinerariifolium]
MDGILRHFTTLQNLSLTLTSVTRFDQVVSITIDCGPIESEVKHLLGSVVRAMMSPNGSIMASLENVNGFLAMNTPPDDLIRTYFKQKREENPSKQSRLGIFLSKEIFKGGVIRIHNAFVQDVGIFLKKTGHRPGYLRKDFYESSIKAGMTKKATDTLDGGGMRCMMEIFHDMIEKTMEVFMDDFSVFRNSFQTCLSYLEKMLKRCEDTNLCLNWEKSYFMVKEGIVLGHKIAKNEINVDKAKVKVIAKLPHLTTVKGIRSFLGHAGFYRRFIKVFSKIAWPMTRLLEKDTLFFFTKECVEAFQTLKRKLTEAPLLIAPD